MHWGDQTGQLHSECMWKPLGFLWHNWIRVGSDEQVRVGASAVDSYICSSRVGDLGKLLPVLPASLLTPLLQVISLVFTLENSRFISPQTAQPSSLAFPASPLISSLNSPARPSPPCSLCQPISASALNTCHITSFSTQALHCMSLSLFPYFASVYLVCLNWLYFLWIQGPVHECLLFPSKNL